ncbi:MAG: sigma-54-dependent Fis family transcriptional regulator, partial [Deltaproteobacteria bacterium]|nr:sigma-54-dependent Fis family transcriptional regulator [Deltaproteobacteria bacterium]
HRFRSGAFANADMALLDAFTDQAGLAIENAQLIGVLTERGSALDAEVKATTERLQRAEALLESQTPFTPKLDYGPIVAHGVSMQAVVRVCDKVADTDLGVLLLGESGTGKELIARALHRNHHRRGANLFVAINCGAIPANLIESELFGYKAGAFTGATRDKRGLVEEAEGGTLFLDEVTELDAALQGKLLRVLQERECTRLGDTRPFSCDIRVIAASNKDIEGMVASGRFREDLYYRICQLKITMPPLSARAEDIPELAQTFLAEAAPTGHLRLHPRLLKRLLDYSWPGNVRELRNVIQVAAALCEGDVIDERAVPTYHPLALPTQPDAPSPASTEPPSISIDPDNPYDPRKSWHDYEQMIVAKAFAANQFQARPTAAELQIGLTTLYKRIHEWNLLDQANPIYQAPFRYERGRHLADYLPRVFMAAYQYANRRPYIAIASLKISQGYFYKVMRGVPH